MTTTPKPKKIALLISSFLPNMGGIEVGLHNIAVRLQNHGLEPVVIAPYPHVKALAKKGWHLPYKVEALPPKIWSILARWHWMGFKIMNFYLGYLNKKHNFSFWHVTMGYPAGCVIVHYAEQSKDDIQYLIRCAGEDIQKQPDIGYGMRLAPAMDNIISHYLRKAQRLVAITESVGQEYDKIGISKKQVYKIPNGVDLERFSLEIDRPKVRQKLGVGIKDFLILSVGRNHPKKNFRTLIEAGALLLDVGVQNFKILCVGNACEDLAEYAQQRGMANHIILKGQIDNEDKTPGKFNLPADALIEIYKAADLFAFPSLIETFGIAIVEAMASGLPVIVGDSEGCRDVVENGKWGVMCDPHDATELSEKIKQFMQDEKLRDSYKSKSRKRALDFDWNNIVNQYLSIYRENW